MDFSCKKGEFNVQLSGEALALLNNAQRKEFVINQRYLNLLKEVYDSRDTAYQFPTKVDFYKTQCYFEEWSDSFWNSIFDVMFYRITRGIIRVKKRDPNGVHGKILDMCKVNNKFVFLVDLFVRKSVLVSQLVATQNTEFVDASAIIIDII